jgi:cytochrome c biogenesis protein CcmG/thiol:disulfide interchange protein DsbE
MKSVKHKSFLFCTLITILLLSGFFPPADGGEADFFQKVGAKQTKVKKTAPNFCLKDLNGQKVELKNFKGKVIFLNFWATWCGPCKEEMSSMESLWQWFKGKEFVLLSISVDYEGVKPVKEYIERQRYTFRVLIDPQCQTLDLYEVKAIPTTLIIDKKGQIVAMAIGPKDWKSSEAILLVDLLIKN